MESSRRPNTVNQARNYIQFCCAFRQRQPLLARYLRTGSISSIPSQIEARKSSLPAQRSRRCRSYECSRKAALTVHRHPLLGLPVPPPFQKGGANHTPGPCRARTNSAWYLIAKIFHGARTEKLQGRNSSRKAPYNLSRQPPPRPCDEAGKKPHGVLAQTCPWPLSARRAVRRRN